MCLGLNTGAYQDWSGAGKNRDIGVATTNTGKWPSSFLKIKQMRLNREQRQLPTYTRKILGVTVSFLA